jgi:hypothetical protein
MGRGRTTTGMVAASLIATVADGEDLASSVVLDGEDAEELENGAAGETARYLNG